MVRSLTSGLDFFRLCQETDSDYDEDSTDVEGGDEPTLGPNTPSLPKSAVPHLRILLDSDPPPVRSLAVVKIQLVQLQLSKTIQLCLSARYLVDCFHVYVPGAPNKSVRSDCAVRSPRAMVAWWVPHSMR